IWTRAGARVWRGGWIGQIGERKNVFSVLEALIRKRPVAVMVKLIAQCKISSQPPCQIRTDQRPRRPSYINRPVANKKCGVDVARFGVSGFPEVIGGLGQYPDVVIGNQAVRRCIRSAAVAGG